MSGNVGDGRTVILQRVVWVIVWNVCRVDFVVSDIDIS